MDSISGPIKAIIIAVFVLACGFTWWLLEQQQERIREMVEETESAGIPGRDSTPVVKSSRLRELRKTMHQDPAAALRELDTIVADPADAEEKAAAESMAPQLISLAYHQATRDKEIETAAALRKRLNTEYPAASETAQINTSWGRELGQRLFQAVEAGNAATIETLYAEYRGGGYYKPRYRDGRWYPGDESVLSRVSQYHAEQWAALPEAEKWSEPGREQLAAALDAWLDHNASFQRHQTLAGRDRDASSVKPWLETANHYLVEKQYVPALNAFHIARAQLQRGAPWQAGQQTQQEDREQRQQREAAIESRVADLAVYLAAQPPGSIVTPLLPEQQFDMIAKVIQNPTERLKLEQAKLQFAANQFLEQTESLPDTDLAALAKGTLPYDARNSLNSLLHNANNLATNVRDKIAYRIFDTQLRSEDLDPFATASPELLALIESSIPTDTPADRVDDARRSQARKIVRDRPYLNPVPLPDGFIERYYQMRAVDGLYALGHSTDEATRKLREVIRRAPDPALVDQVRNALQEGLRHAGEQAELEKLIALAGLYASEFGDNLAGDPFSGEFLALLQKAAGQFEKDAPMKYLFVQALIASGFPHDPAGQKAQEATIRGAFQAVARVSKSPADESALIPSTLPNRSSESIDNSTDYHLLVVYDGPERFAVLCDPLRKGSLPLANGTYRIAVMTPIGNIQPYHTERTMQNQHAITNYFVQQAGSNLQGVSRAMGDYTLLRNPDNATIQIDPRTGMLRP